MINMDLQKINHCPERVGCQLTVFEHGAYYRFSDLVQYFSVVNAIANIAEELLTRPKRGSSSLPYGFRCGREVIVRGCDFTRAVVWAEESAVCEAGPLEGGEQPS